MRDLVGRAVAANRRASRALERRLPHARSRLRDRFEDRVAELMNATPGLVVVDVGGGRRCHFAHRRQAELGTRIVAVDVSEAELAPNAEVDEKRVADVTRGLPFGDGEVDLVVSRSVLEHLRDVEPLVADVARVLRPGGHTVHLFPSRYAPFSLANRLLPREASRRLVHAVVPGSEGRLGFPAYYDHCSESAMRRLFERHGLEVVEAEVGWYQAEYFDFVLPLYAANALWELAVRRAGRRDLAANVLLVARKPV